MNFQSLTKVEKYDWYIDLAFRNAKKAASEIKSQKRAGPTVIKRAELAKISSIRRVLRKHLDLILKSFPSIDSLPEFYQELIRTTLDYAELKKSLGSVRWAQQKIDHFSDVYHKRIRRCMAFRKLTEYSREYYGRISSILKQIKKQLEYLEHSRRVMKAYPSVKTKLFTIAIAGFPNVGKTTLLTKLTTSKPEIAAYPFTTKNLNIGYADINNQKVQFIDTPGTLNRFEKMNPIERQAHLAIKYCADMIVYVADPSGHSYPAKKQIQLFRNLEKTGKQLAIYLSKTDISDPKEVDSFLKELKKSAKPIKFIYKDAKDLKTIIAIILGKEKGC